MSDLEWSVARLNICRFQQLLARETDTPKRLRLLGLLAEEEAKLAALTKALAPPSKPPA